MNKQDALQQIEELKAKLAELEANVNTPEKEVIELWEPKGCWYVDTGGDIHEGFGGFTSNTKFGNYFLTKESANKAVVAMRKHNRLLAYVSEHAPGYEPDWSNPRSSKWFVEFCHSSNLWFVSYHNYWERLGVVYMPEEITKKLCEDLNSGRVVL
jgi:hypothetical protein